MRRREFVSLAAGAAAWPLAARAQRGSAVKRIAWLSNTAEQDSLAKSELQLFQQELAKRGWIEGQNLTSEYRWGAAGDDGRARAGATELISRSPDVILVTGTQLTAALKQQTSTIPIVFVNVADPVASRFAASFARPGGNITGFRSQRGQHWGRGWLGWVSILGF